MRLVAGDKTAPDELALGYAALTSIIEPATVGRIIHPDPDDDAVIASADAAQGEAIVSGDSRLLDLKQYGDIRVLTATELVKEIS